VIIEFQSSLVAGLGGGGGQKEIPRPLADYFVNVEGISRPRGD
jgi:hypothetical protein